VVTTIDLTVNTESGYDLLIIKDSRGNEIARRSGTLGNITVDVSSSGASGVSFTFTSDGSVVPPGGVAAVRGITCGSPNASTCPSNTTPMYGTACRNLGGTCVAPHPIGCCCKLTSVNTSTPTGAENCCDGVDVTQAE
jgi:hypothetical protein